MGHQIEGLEHIGIAVANIEDAIRSYSLLGFERTSIENLGDQGMQSHIVTGENTCIELLESTTDQSSLASFLANNGPGLHHICLRVRSLEDSVDHLTASGFELTTRDPIEDQRGRRVFLHPRGVGGVLVGIVEPWNGTEG